MTITARRLALLGGAAVSLLAAAAQANPLPAAPAVVAAAQSRNAAALPALPDVDIPFTKMVLSNGLTLIVHEDHKAPIVAVNIWYHVGSKNEPTGRSGFAHLFEHLMFNGSENYNNDFFKGTELLGATDQNGTTNTDRTNYFQNVPTSALDSILWLESDRMGHLQGAIDQARLDEQRGVVQNEKRQGENQPYGQVWEQLNRALYPVGHPYHHSVIGSMNDLNAASLDDVKTWFRTWYGPNNAVLVLAGDIDLATAKEKAAKYFGSIPAGPTMAQPKVDVAKRPADTREVMTDKVPQARIYRAWNVAQVGTTDVDQLQLLAYVLGGAKSSRLSQRLQHQDKLVDNISAGAYASQLGSNFMVMATVKQGQDPAKVEKIIDEEIERLLKDGPTAEELARAKTGSRAGFIRGIERIGGFGGKADALAECTVYTGDPGCFRTSLANIDKATAADLKRLGAQWLDKGSHTLVVEPGERVALKEDPSQAPKPFNVPAVDSKYSTLPEQVDRKAGVPQTREFPQLKFPALQRATLKNGTQVVLAERHEIPVVQFSYQFPGGFTADQGRKPGTANFTMSLMTEGAGKLGSLAFADAADALGADLDASAGLDSVDVELSALKENLVPSLALYASLLREPRFEQSEIDRVKATWIAGIQQEKVNPGAVAMRVLPPLLYGKGHPYAIPFTGSGDEAAISSLGREDLVDFHRDWLRPQDGTLIVVGDTTLAEIVPLLDKQLGDWKATGDAPTIKATTAVALPKSPRVFLIDQPGAVQANLFAGQVVPPSSDASSTRFDIANGVIGGDFTSRLNMNLREDKHWSYGARTSASNTVGQRPWMAMAPVQIDKTGPAMAEMRKEIAEFANGSKPATDAEVARIRNIQTLSLPGAYETASAVAATIGTIVQFKRPDDYVLRRKAEIEAMTPAQVQQAAAEIKPQALTWVVVGDLKQTEAAVRALNLGEVTVIDAEGNPVKK